MVDRDQPSADPLISSRLFDHIFESFFHGHFSGIRKTTITRGVGYEVISDTSCVIIIIIII